MTLFLLSLSSLSTSRFFRLPAVFLLLLLLLLFALPFSTAPTNASPLTPSSSSTPSPFASPLRSLAPLHSVHSAALPTIAPSALPSLSPFPTPSLLHHSEDALPVVVAAAAPTRDPATREWYKNRNFAHGRLVGVSKQGLLRESAREMPGASEKVLALAKWFQTRAQTVEKMKKMAMGDDCNIVHVDWIRHALYMLADRGIGPGLLKRRCTTGVQADGQDALQARNIFRNAAAMWAGAVSRVASDLPRYAYRGGAKREIDYSNAYPLSDWAYMTSMGPQNCTLERAAALRRNNQWFLLASATNRQVDEKAPNWKRLRLEEWVSPALNETLPVFANGTLAGSKEEAYSTLLIMFPGRVDISLMYRMNYTENYALNQALEMNEHGIGQATDALYLSNIAILGFPLLLSFIPVALIADLSDIATFFYVLFTDVFTALPLLVKGTELVSIGRTESVASTFWIVGDDNLKISEAWVATCNPDRLYVHWGVVFIIVGLCVIAIGIALEIGARAFMNKRIASGADPQPLGPVLLHLNPYVALGAQRQFPREYGDAFFLQQQQYGANFAGPPAPNIAADMEFGDGSEVLTPPPPTLVPPTGPSAFGLLRRVARRRQRVLRQVPTAQSIGLGVPDAPLSRNRNRTTSAPPASAPRSAPPPRTRPMPGASLPPAPNYEMDLDDSAWWELP